jgi:hypothetical protein
MSDFGTASIDLEEKPGFDRFFQKLVPKPTGFWNKLQYYGNLPHRPFFS